MTILVVDSQCHSIRFNMFSGILYNIIWSCITHVTIWYVIRKSPYFPRSWDGNQVPSMSSAIRRSLGWDSYWFDGVVCMFFYLLGYYMKHVWLRSSIVYMLETWIWCFFVVSIWDFLTLCPGWSQIHGLSDDPAEIEVNSTSSTCLFWEFSLREALEGCWKHKLRMTDLGHFAESLVPSKCATPHHALPPKETSSLKRIVVNYRKGPKARQLFSRKSERGRFLVCGEPHAINQSHLGIIFQRVFSQPPHLGDPNDKWFMNPHQWLLVGG
jgi:hypothetical protein